MEEVFDFLYRLIDILLPFTWTEIEYQKLALLAIVLIAPMCAAMGVPATSFRMVFFSSAVSHSVFAGIALGLIIGIDAKLSMVLFGLIIGLGIIHVRRRSELSNDTIIGVFFSFTVALGIVIMSSKRYRYFGPRITATVYGDILNISQTEVALLLVLFVLTFLFLGFSYNRLILKGINDRLASTHGVRTKYYDYAFAALLAVVITSSIPTVGFVVLTALLVVPAGAARNLARSARQQFWLSILIGLSSGIAGFIASDYWDTATGATIILFACMIFMLTQYALPAVRKIILRL